MVKTYDKARTGVDGGAAENFSARHLQYNEYLNENERVQGRWIGPLCADLGLTHGGVVQDKEFHDLSLNRHPVTGGKLTRQAPNRKPWCDTVVTIPKTFSVLYVLGGDDRVLEWHRNAVEKMLKEMYRVIGRQAHNGREHMEFTGSFAASLYEHAYSRCEEANLHTHITIQNVTKAQNGKFYAIDFRELTEQTPFLTALYRDEIAKQALAAGLNLTIGMDGEPDITELLPQKDKHSTRSKELAEVVEAIEAHAGTRLSGPVLGMIVRASRGLRLEEFKARWDATKGEPIKSLDPETAAAAMFDLVKRFAETVSLSSEQRMIKSSGSEILAKQMARVTAEEREILERLKRTMARDQPVKLPSLTQSIEFAIEDCFERESVLRDYKLYEAVLQHAQGAGVNMEEMNRILATHPKLVRGERREISPSLHYRREVESLLWIEEGKGQGIAIPHGDIDDELNESQRKAVEGTLASIDRVTAWNGAAGVGKTFAISRVIEANLKAGHKVMVVAPSDDARDVLIKYADKLPKGSAAAEVLRNAVSLQLFQANPKLHDSLGKDDLLVIDEASRISLEQGHTAAMWSQDRGTRVCLVGDPDQGNSVDAGDWFRIMLKKSGVHTEILHDIRRQSPDALEGHYLAAIKLLKKGKVLEGCAELHQAGRLHEIQGKKRVEAYAEAILRSEDAGIAAIATNPSHRENDDVAEAVRRRMHERGQLTDERVWRTHRSLNWTTAKKKEFSRYKRGMILEQTRGNNKGDTWKVEEVFDSHVMARNESGVLVKFRACNAKSFDVCEERDLNIAINDILFYRSGSKNGKCINGERIKVAGWDKDGNPIASDGRSITHRNVTYAYAATTAKVQGMDDMEVITGFDRYSVRWLTRELIYTACSRGRVSIHVFLENLADIAQIQNRSGARKAATEMEIKPENLPEEVRVILDKIEQCRTKAETKERDRQVADLQENARKPKENKQEMNIEIKVNAETQEHSLVANGKEIAKVPSLLAAEKVRDGIIKAKEHKVSRAAIRAAEEQARRQSERSQERSHGIER